MAERVSFSPNCSSSVATVSFSLIIGNDAQFQQGQEGMAGIQVAPAFPRIVSGQEDLGHHLAVFPKELLVDLHEQALTDRGHGLPFRKALWAGWRY